MLLSSLFEEIKNTLSDINRLAVKKFGERLYIILNSGDIKNSQH